MMRWSLSAACLLALCAYSLSVHAGPSAEPAAPAAPAAAQATAAAPARASGVLLENFDKTVRPQDDFYRYVSGVWLAKTQIPADKSNYGLFGKLEDDVQRQLHAIVDEAAAAKAAPGSDKQLVGDFYASFMDETRIEKVGLAPLEPEFARIAAIDDGAALLDYLAHAQLIGLNTPIALGILPDAKRPEFVTVWTQQSGLAMPDRDYYLEDEARYVEFRKAYVAYLTDVFARLGRKDAAEAAQRVMDFETRLARSAWSQVELRDVDKNYNPYDVAGATKASPGLDWNRYFERVGIRSHDHLIVGQPSYFADLGKALGDVPLETWRDYLKIRVVDSFAPYLDAKMVERNFDFYGRTLSGTPELRPRWKRGLAETETAMGDLLGKTYVERHFPPQAKKRMDELVANLTKAFGLSIDELEWMGPETRREAHAKLQGFSVKIGYPEKWKEYPGLEVRRDDLVGNVLRAREVNTKRELAKLGRPVDRTEWYMTPQTVNAYYNPLGNEIVFPAAILQPPFFDMNADDAVNYGGIGAVIGHEISHGFDDQGRKFDGTGALRDWWTAEDNERFSARTQKLVGQYAAFSPLPGLNVNGELTLGENIGDLSGLAVAHKAYRLSLDGKPAPVLDGYSGDQRFFIGWAQVWPRLYREDELRRRLVTDPHSPSEYRVNGIVRNMPQFVEAFDLKSGDRLYLPSDQQVRIW
ncbi:MAG: M13 family peptidase [Lysobacterales bacterium]|nr:MAG: M13 family peptidase [Xanthomonadales bacterium]